MNEHHDNILDAEFETSFLRRRDLLPTWIKVFIWIFMIMGAFVPFGFLAGIFGIPFNASLYGFQSTDPLSLIGILLFGLFALKGMVAFGLWTEKDWAVNLAMIDAILGIVLCIIVLIIYVVNSSFTMRLEILILIPYFLKMKEIKPEWLARKEG